MCSLKASECKMLNFITDSVGRGGCQEVWRKGVAGSAMGEKKETELKFQQKKKKTTNWNKDECCTEPHTEYKRQLCEICMAGWNAENNTKLQALPVTHNVGPDP